MNYNSNENNNSDQNYCLSPNDKRLINNLGLMDHYYLDSLLQLSTIDAMIEFLKTDNNIQLIRDILPFLTTEESQVKATLYLVNSIEDIIRNETGRISPISYSILGDFDYFSTLFSDNKSSSEILATLNNKIDNYNKSHTFSTEKDISLMNETERYELVSSFAINSNYKDFICKITMSIDAQKRIEPFLEYTDDEKISKIEQLLESLNKDKDDGLYSFPTTLTVNGANYIYYYPEDAFTQLKCLHLAKALSSDKAKKTVIKLFFNNPHCDFSYITELAKTLDSDMTKIEVITECFDGKYESYAFAIAKTLKSDESKLEIIRQRLVPNFDIALVLTLETDEAKLKALDILYYLYEEPYDFDFVTIVRTLKTDNSRLQAMELAKDYFSDSDNYLDIQFEIASTLTSTDAIIRASEIVDNKDILRLARTDNANCTEDDLRINYQNCNTSQIPGVECLLPSEKDNSNT